MPNWLRKLLGLKPLAPRQASVEPDQPWPRKPNPWVGDMPVFKGKPVDMPPPAPYERDPNWRDPAPTPPRLVPNMQPGRTVAYGGARGGGRPALRRVDDERRNHYDSPSPSPAYSDPMTDMLSPLNPISPLYHSVAPEPSYAPHPAPIDSGYCASPPPSDYTSSPSFDTGSCGGGSDTSGGGW